MDSLMQNSAYFGFFITLMGYWCAVQVGKRMRSTLCNPLLLSIIFIIAFLKLTNISYDSYDNGAKYINYFLTPSTVCLAVPLYRQLKLLKEYAGAILISIISGTVACAIMIFAMSRLFALDTSGMREHDLRTVQILCAGDEHLCLFSTEVHHHCHCTGHD